MLLQIAVANVLAVICYYGVLGKQQSATSFLLAFGFVIPLTTWAPFVIMDQLDIRSTVLRMGLVALPLCVQLKCLQGKTFS